MSVVEPSPCADCGTATTPCLGRRGCRHIGRWEWYMVRPALWELAWIRSPNRTVNQFGVSDGFLCIACLEARLGRRLTSADFIDAPVNDPYHPWNTPRLTAALTRWAPRATARPARQQQRVFRRRTPHGSRA